MGYNIKDIINPIILICVFMVSCLVIHTYKNNILKVWKYAFQHYYKYVHNTQQLKLIGGGNNSIPSNLPTTGNLDDYTWHTQMLTHVTVWGWQRICIHASYHKYSNKLMVTQLWPMGEKVIIETTAILPQQPTFLYNRTSHERLVK